MLCLHFAGSKEPEKTAFEESCASANAQRSENEDLLHQGRIQDQNVDDKMHEEANQESNKFSSDDEDSEACDDNSTSQQRGIIMVEIQSNVTNELDNLKKEACSSNEPTETVAKETETKMESSGNFRLGTISLELVNDSDDSSSDEDEDFEKFNEDKPEELNEEMDIKEELNSTYNQEIQHEIVPQEPLKFPEEEEEAKSQSLFEAVDEEKFPMSHLKRKLAATIETAPIPLPKRSKFSLPIPVEKLEKKPAAKSLQCHLCQQGFGEEEDPHKVSEIYFPSFNSAHFHTRRLFFMHLLLLQTLQALWRHFDANHSGLSLEEGTVFKTKRPRPPVRKPCLTSDLTSTSDTMDLNSALKLAVTNIKSSHPSEEAKLVTSSDEPTQKVDIFYLGEKTFC